MNKTNKETNKNTDECVVMCNFPKISYYTWKQKHYICNGSRGFKCCIKVIV